MHLLRGPAHLGGSQSCLQPIGIAPVHEARLGNDVLDDIGHGGQLRPVDPILLLFWQLRKAPLHEPIEDVFRLPKIGEGGVQLRLGEVEEHLAPLRPNVHDGGGLGVSSIERHPGERVRIKRMGRAVVPPQLEPHFGSDIPTCGGFPIKER